MFPNRAKPVNTRLLIKMLRPLLQPFHYLVNVATLSRALSMSSRMYVIPVMNPKHELPVFAVRLDSSLGCLVSSCLFVEVS